MHQGIMARTKLLIIVPLVLALLVVGLYGCSSSGDPALKSKASHEAESLVSSTLILSGYSDVQAKADSVAVDGTKVTVKGTASAASGYGNRQSRTWTLTGSFSKNSKGEYEITNKDLDLGTWS